MKQKIYATKHIWLTLLLLAGLMAPAMSQTPGLIYSPATNGGAKVLDPNGDGYISKTTAGFSGSLDIGAANSELDYRPAPTLETEPLGDLNTGSTGGHTDLAPPSPVQVYFDGTNLLFRMRLGGASTASKGYSVLIDTDGKFGDLVAGGNAATTPNPGFEFEVILESNFDVAVYDHRNAPNGGPKIFSRSVGQYSQKAVAATANGGNPDYFYDFYVPLSALPGVTADTPLRISGVTITSAQSGITGTVSDIGGVNFQAYDYDKQKAWAALMGKFPRTSLNTIRTSGFPLITATAPNVTGPILANSTSLSGTSVEAAGSVVSVFRNGVSICGGAGQPACPTVSASGTWTLSGISSTLLKAGDNITATVAPSGRTVSAPSNTVTVTAPVVCTTTPAPQITGLTNSNTKYITGTTSYLGKQRISIYTATPSGSTYTYELQGSYVFTSTTTSSALPISTTGMSATTGTVTASKAGNYVITTTPVDANNAASSCESLRSNQVCYQSGGQGPVNSIVPTITKVTGNNGSEYTSLTDAPAGLSSISGTLSSYPSSGTATVIVIKNATQQSFRSTVSSVAPYNWSINTTGLTLAAGDVVFIRSEVTLACGAALSSASNLAFIKQTTATPSLNPLTNCGAVKAVTGISDELGSTVTIFANGVSTGLTALVNASGKFAVDVSSYNGGTGIAAGTPITARASTTGKAASAVSNTVTAAAAPSGAIAVNAPINEGATTISGTAPASSLVTLYIDGTPYTAVTANASGIWTVNGLDPKEVFAGATVTASFKTSANDQCSSAKATPVTVVCMPPSMAPTITPAGTQICSGGNAVVTVGNSQQGISYRLMIQSGTDPNFTYTETGASVLGTGGTITLTSGALTSAATLRVRARKISGTTCEVLLPGQVTVGVNPLPANNYSLSINSSTGCAGASPVITVTNAQTGYRYELINHATKALVTTAAGSPNPNAPNTAGNITFTVASVSATTTYGLRITNTNQTTSCSVENATQVTYTVTGPAANQPVTISTTQTCSGGSAVISIQTNNDGATYQLYEANNNTPVASTASNPTSFTGDGKLKTVTVSPATSTTYYFKVTGTGGTCSVNVQNRVTLTISSAGPTVSAGTTQTVCGSTVSLQGSDPAPGTGAWSITSRPGDNTTASVTSSGQTATGTGLTSGTYVFTYTVSYPNCGNRTANVTVIVNCPASYSIAPPKYRNQYAVNEPLATASDPDKLAASPATSNGIASSTFTGSLPPGTELQSNGNLRVSSPQSLVPGTYNFTVTTVDERGVATTSPLTVTIYGQEPAITPLPVELVYFTAVVQNSQVQLQWLTASEENNKEFEIQRSSDGKSFRAVGTVEGSGTTNSERKYSFDDATPLVGTAYYRLKQIDYNGDFEYSKTIAVNKKGLATEQQLQVYPNPFTSNLNITVTSELGGKASYQLVNLQGKVVHRGQVQLQPGVSEMVLPLQQVRSGIYILKISGENFNAATKVLKTQ